MINLIPKEEKKKMAYVLYYKVLMLFVIMKIVIVIMFFIILLPSYFLTSVKDSIVQNKLESQKVEPVPSPDEATLATIKSINNNLNIIESSRKNQFLVSRGVISSILQKKISSVKITDISYDNDPTKGRKITIQGTAPSREILLLFRRGLEDDVAFKQVDLPISNFVQGSNIKFSLSLIPS